MQVRLRHIDSVESVPFTTIHFSEIPELIKFIQDSGGVHVSDMEDTFPYLGHQIEVDNSVAYLDVYVGTE